MGILEDARLRFEEADRAELENRERAEKAINFTKGDQWDERIKRKRKENELPCTVYNQCDTLVSRVKSSIVANLPTLIVLPEEEADAENANNMQKIIKHIERRSKAESIYKDTAQDIINGGFGYWRILNQPSRHDTFEQEIVMKKIHNRFNVYFDPAAMEDTFEDAKWCFITEMLKKDDFEKQFPGVNVDNFFDKSNQGNFQDKWFYDGKVRVAEYFWKKPSKQEVADITHINGKRLVVKLDEDITTSFLEANDYEINEVKEIETEKVMWAKMIGEKVLDGPMEFPSDFIPIVKAVGKKLIVNGKQEYYSLIENVMAPQSLLNYALTTESIMVGTQSKATWLAARDLVENDADLFAESHKENIGLLMFDRNPLHPGDKPELIRPPASSQGFINLIEFANRKIEETSGVTDAFLGKKSNEVSGRAIALRSQGSESVVSDFADNLLVAIIYGGRIMINMVGKIYNKPDMIVRIIGDKNAIEYLKLNPLTLDDDGLMVLEDISREKYDYVVDAATTHKTKRRENVANLLQIYQLSGSNPVVQALILPKMISNMDMEGAAELADEIRQALGGGTPQGSPPAAGGDLNEQAQAGRVAVAGQ